MCLFTLSFLVGEALAQDGSPAKGGGSGLQMFIPLLFVFVIFYFMLIRPQARQQKKQKEMVAALKKGDEVILNSGIHGRIQAITDQSLSLEIDENCRIRVERSAVASLKGSPLAK